MEVRDAHDFEAATSVLLPVTIEEHTNGTGKDCYKRSMCSTSCPYVTAVLEGGFVLCESLLTYAAFHNPMCGIVFRCGCTWDPWLGGTGWKNCNVHNPGMRSPRCPWCMSPRDTPSWTWATAGRTSVAVGMMIVWVFMCWKTSKRQHVLQNGATWWSKFVGLTHYNLFLNRAVLAPLLFFFLFHIFDGLVWCLATGYPHWMLKDVFPNTQPASAPLWW